MLHPFRQHKNLVHRQRKRLTNKCFITHSQAAEKSQPQKVTVWDMNDFQLKSFYQVLESDLTLALLGASLVAQTVKNPPAMLETWVRSLGWEDSLEEEMATHSRILAWRIPWTEEPGRLQSMGLQRVGSNFHFHFFFQRQNCTSFGAGRVGRVGGRTGRKKPNSKTIILAFGFVMMLNLLLLYFRFTDVKYFCLTYTTSAGKT